MSIESDTECVEEIVNTVCRYVGHRPAYDALPLIASALAHVLGVIERAQPGAAAIIMPGLVAGITKSVHIVAAGPASPEKLN